MEPSEDSGGYEKHSLDVFRRNLSAPFQDVFSSPVHDCQEASVRYRAIGPIDDEVIGDFGCADPEISFGILPPLISQVDIVSAAHFPGRTEIDVESSSAYYDVKFIV